MAKIDYSKAEREMHEALQRMRVKNLAEGKSVTSKRAAEYYGLEEQTPRPTPEEPVAKLLREEAAKEEIEEKQSAEQKAQQPPAEAKSEPPSPMPIEAEEEEEEPPFEVIRRPPVYDVIRKARGQSSRPPKAIAAPPPEVPPSDKFLEPSSHVYILRQHILWLKRKHFDNRYELLGTTKEEVMSFRHAKRLNEEQVQRIKELNSRAEEVKAGILAEEGVKTEELLIQKQKEKHKTKRFNVKDTWLPL